MKPICHRFFGPVLGSFLLCTLWAVQLPAQDPQVLLMKLKAKLDQVNDYVAEGAMKTDVAFIKAPVGKVKVYFKKPNRFKLERNGGISILPKGGISVNLGNLLATDDFLALDAGVQTMGKDKVRIIKMLPQKESADIVLSTLYVDEAQLLIRKTATTTKENGTYEMEMTYGPQAHLGLPSKVVFSFNAKDYKLPKGIALEFDDADAAAKEKMKGKKGRVEIVYSSYRVNQGIADAIFR